MPKKYFFGAGILLICLAGWGIYKVYKPHGNVGSDEAVISIHAATLYNEFQTKEAQANKKWLGKVIEVTGTITSINESGNYVSVNLGGGPEGGVDCSVLKKDLQPALNLAKGDTVIVKGKCTGFLMDVNLVDCVIKK
jgi:hypothetical protein